MPSALTDIELCNTALVRLGAKTFTSFDDGSDMAEICSTQYEITLGRCLSAHPWRFATEKEQLARLATPPVNGWKYAYQLPTSMISGPWAVYDSLDENAPPLREFEIYGDKLYSDSEVVVIDYRKEVPEQKFPAWFQELMVLALCSVFAPSVTEKADLAQQFSVEAWGTPSDDMQGGWFANCKRMNAQQAPARSFDDGGIVATRFS